jgi:hypothetical protein
MWRRGRKVMKKTKLSHCCRSVHPCRAVIQNAAVLKWHTAIVHPVHLMKMMMNNRVDYINRHHTNQKPHAKHCPFTLQIVW